MTKKLFAVISAVAVVFFSCTPQPAADEPQKEEQTPSGEDTPPSVDPEDLEPFEYSVTFGSEDYIFSKRPQFTLKLTNPNSVTATAEMKVTVSTDKGKKALSYEFTKDVAAKATETLQITTEEDLAPGFYKITGKVGRKNFLSSTPIGIDPFEIVSAPDYQADFDSFWESALTQLKAVDMKPVFVPTKYDGTYMVELQSIPDGLEGEPMIIRCYYVEPLQDGKAHPVIVHYYGYDDWNPGHLDCPHGREEFAHLYVSTRGQRINCRTAKLRDDGIEEDFQNPYSKQWFTVNFGDKDSYYYRGAYMDCVQGIRFLALCEDERVKGRIDMNNLFVEGMSQGGAFSYAAASLSKDYPVKAIAAAVAFMGDFPDYFTIVPNEGGGFPGMAQNCKKSLGWTDNQMYEFMSYFDTKNLATKISCPIFAAIGLQDNICPPHTNIAPYNNAKTPAGSKQMTFYPKMGHAYPSGWDANSKAFFMARVK